MHRLPVATHRQRLLHQAFDLGFRAFDVAPAYGNGLNEVELGIAFGSKAGDIDITTKFGIPVDLYGERHRQLFTLARVAKKFLAPGYASEYERRDFSAAAMVDSLHGSLRRLRTDRVARFLIHEPLLALSETELEQLNEVSASLKKQGKIGAFGVCGPAGAVTHLPPNAQPDIVQTPLWDMAATNPISSGRRVAFGLFRAYRQLPERDARSFSAFVDATVKTNPLLDVILATASVTTLSSFQELMR